MNVIARSKLQGFWEKHPDTETPLRLWFTSVKKAKWKNLNDLKDHYPKADYIGNDRVVFDIKGNTKSLYQFHWYSRRVRQD
jgi:mRNA interferase HigB